MVMLKKVISVFLCFAAAFTLTVSAFAQSGGAEVEAASSVPLYLRYYYDQMDESHQAVFLKLRTAILNGDKKVSFSSSEVNKIDEEEFQKVIELLIFHDPMTFNFAEVDVDPKDPNALVLKYHYKRETYDKWLQHMRKG